MKESTWLQQTTQACIRLVESLTGFLLHERLGAPGSYICCEIDFRRCFRWAFAGGWCCRASCCWSRCCSCCWRSRWLILNKYRWWRLRLSKWCWCFKHKLSTEQWALLSEQWACCPNLLIIFVTSAPEDTAAKVMETLKSVGMRALIFYFVMQFFRKPATAPGLILHNSLLSSIQPACQYLQRVVLLESLWELLHRTFSQMGWALICKSCTEHWHSILFSTMSIDK